MILGASLTLVDTQPSREPNGLRTLTYFYEGETSAVDAAIAQLPREWGYRKSTADAPRMTLQVIVPNPTDASGGNEESTYKWEILGNDSAKSLLEHPTVLSWHRKYQDIFRTAVLNKDERTFDERVADISDATVLGDYGMSAFQGQVAVAHFQNILNEQAYLVPQYVARLTQTVGNKYTKQISDVYTEYLYTTEQLIAEADSNLTPFSTRMLYKLRNIPSKTNVIDAVGVNHFYWSWLKKSSTESDAARGLTEIQTEWVLDLWSFVTYQIKP